jgi:hypothetical protein
VFQAPEARRGSQGAGIRALPPNVKPRRVAVNKGAKLLDISAEYPLLRRRAGSEPRLLSQNRKYRWKVILILRAPARGSPPNFLKPCKINFST